MVEWIVKTLSQYGLAGLVIGGLAVAVVTLWRRNRSLEDHRARMLEKLLEAAKARQQGKGSVPPSRKVSPSPTSYSISMNTKNRTQD